MAKKIEILENTLLKLLVRRGTDTDRQQIILSEGELGYTTDTERLYVGNGSDTGGNVTGNKFLGSNGGPAATFTEAVIGDMAFNSSNLSLCAFKGNGEWETIATVNDGTVDAGDFNINSVGESIEIDTGGKVALQSTISIDAINSRSVDYLDLPQNLKLGIPTYSFPTNSGANGNVLTTNGNGTLQWAPAGLPTTALFNTENGPVPVGCVIPFTSITAPQGWLVCDGQTYASVDYPDLYDTIGSSYGGDATNFQVPDYRNKTLYGTTSDPSNTADYSIVNGLSSDIDDSFASFGTKMQRVTNSTFYRTSFYISKDGNLFASGYGGGEEIMGDTRDYLAGFNKIQLPFTNANEKVVDYMAAGSDDPCVFVISDKGRIYSSGYNGHGELGLGNTTTRNKFQRVNGFGSNAKYFTVSVGQNNAAHCLVIDENDNLWTWGYNGYGQLGLNDESNRTSPVQVPLDFLTAGAKPVKVFAANNYSCSFLIDSNGDLYSCGYNDKGQLGHGNDNKLDQFKKVSSMVGRNVVDIAISNGTTTKSVYAITSDGSLYSCGFNGVGQLGIGNTTNKSTFQLVDLGGQQVQDISLSRDGSCSVMILTQDGTLRTWGHNNYGQLGTGNTVDYNSPQTPVGNPQNVVKIKGHDATYAFAAFLNEDGEIWSTGYNGYGQLGRGDKNQKTTFGKVRMSKGTVYKDFDLTGYNSKTAMIAVTDKNEIMAAGASDQFLTGDPYGNHETPRPILSRVTTPGEKSLVGGVTNSDVSITGTVYVIKAIPDEVLDTSLSVTDNLSATLDGIDQTLPFNYLNGDVEIGLQQDITLENIEVLGGIETNTLSSNSIQYSDGSIQTVAPETVPFWNVLCSNNQSRTTPAQMRTDRLSDPGDFNGEWSEISKGAINTGLNNAYHSSFNSLMYTMWVDNIGDDTDVTLYNFANDDYFYVYVDDVLQGTYINYGGERPRLVTIDITSGLHRIDIVKNDPPGGSNVFELLGDIIGGNIRFINDEPYPRSADESTEPDEIP